MPTTSLTYFALSIIGEKLKAHHGRAYRLVCVEELPRAMSSIASHRSGVGCGCELSCPER
jgi:hypothetical protein